MHTKGVIKEGNGMDINAILLFALTAEAVLPELLKYNPERCCSSSLTLYPCTVYS